MMRVIMQNTGVCHFLLAIKSVQCLFYLIHTDIWGPTVPNVTGSRWFVSLTDDCIRVTWTFLLKHKSDKSIIFPRFHNMIQNQLGVKAQNKKNSDLIMLGITLTNF